jgi:hypothetical protein
LQGDQKSVQRLRLFLSIQKHLKNPALIYATRSDVSNSLAHRTSHYSLPNAGEHRERYLHVGVPLMRHQCSRPAHLAYADNLPTSRHAVP